MRARLRRHPPAPRPDPTPGLSLEVRGLRLAFGDTPAVRDLSLSLSPGELYGLVGPDGAGKTTAIRAVVGVLVPDAGHASIDGRPVAPGSSSTLEALGYMPQQYSLYGDLSVDENLAFFGALFGLPRDAIRARRERLMAVTRLGRFGDRRADALSGGMYKKLALACALLHRPRVLLLDEPTNGVDPVSRRELWDLLHQFLEEGMAILVATPYMDEAARCHRVGLMHAGRLLAEGRPDALVDAFEHETLRVRTADRDGLERELAQHADVLAVSPQAADLRVVVRRGRSQALREALLGRGRASELVAVAPDFEDVYLARVADADLAAGAGAADG